MSKAATPVDAFRPEHAFDPFKAARDTARPECRMMTGDGTGAFGLTEVEAERLKLAASPSHRADLQGSFFARRLLIADITATEAEDVLLSAHAEGAPVLVSPNGWAVSLSTKATLTAVALDRAPSDIGIDLELVRSINWKSMLPMICSEEEKATFESHFEGSPVALTAFFRLWTLKEAILKTTGRGFRAGPKAIDTSAHVGEDIHAGQLQTPDGIFGYWTATHGDVVVTVVKRRN